MRRPVGGVEVGRDVVGEVRWKIDLDVSGLGGEMISEEGISSSSSSTV